MAVITLNKYWRETAMRNNVGKIRHICARIISVVLCVYMLLVMYVPTVYAADDGSTVEPSTETVVSVEETSSPAPAEATPAPVEATPAPVEATPAPVEATPAPIEATPAPIEATPVPDDAKPAPVDPEFAPTATPALIEAPATLLAYQELTAHTEDRNVDDQAAVTVKGTLPQGASVSITKLSANSKKYAEAAVELEKKELESENFLSFDITIRDTDGNEVEPDSTVYVSIDLGKNLLPKEADLATLAVVHMEENAAGKIIKAVDVTAPSTAKIEVAENNAVAAEFKTDSFSQFTISWKSDLLGLITYFDITVHFVNTDGNEIDEPKHDGVSIQNGESLTFSTLAPTVSGLTYQSAHYGTYNGSAITSVAASRSGNLKNTTRTLTFKNGEQTVNTLNHTIKNGTVDPTKTADLYFVYKSSGSGTDPVVPVKSLTKEIAVGLNMDGTYDLSLLVSGAVGSITNKSKVDILLIVDKTGSMKWNMTDNSNASKPNRRIDKVADAVRSLTTTISANTGIDAHYNVVTFSSASSTSCVVPWTDNAGTVNSTIGDIYPSGGTNYQAGIYRGKEQLELARSDAQKIVIFLTDGEPTYRGTTSDSGDGSSDPSNNNINAAAEEIKTMTCTKFYAIGAGPTFGSSANSQPVLNLQTLCNNVKSPNTAKYAATNTAALNQAFADITAEIVSLLCTNVTVTDTLSENVDVVMNSGTPKKLLVTVTNNTTGANVVSPATSVTLPATAKNSAATISATYNGTTRQLKLNFPSSYQLEANYTYKIAVTIDASEQAYENYRENGNAYPNTGESNTGTYAGQPGLFTNSSATATYTYNGENKTENYSKPVIQLKPGKLRITKSITGLDNDADAMDALYEQLAFTVTLNGSSQIVNLSDFDYDANTKILTYEIRGLSPNTTYSVVETGEEIEPIHHYDVAVSKTGDTGTIGKNETKTAAFENNYTPSVGTLIIKKTVTAENAARLSNIISKLNGKLSFTYGANTTAAVTATNYANGVYTLTIADVPVGSYAFSENNYEVLGYICTPTGVPANVTVESGGTTTVGFTNDYVLKTGAVQITKNLVDENGESVKAEAGATYLFEIKGKTIANEDATYYLAVTVKKGQSSATATLNGVLYGTYTITELNSINAGGEASISGSVTVSDGNPTATFSATNTYDYHMQTATDVAVNKFHYENNKWTWTRKVNS